MNLKKICGTLTLTAMLAAGPLWYVNPAAAEGTDRKVVLTVGSQQALLNDIEYPLEVPPMLVESTTFLPLRFVAEEVLGVPVNWDQQTKTISFKKNDFNIELVLNNKEAKVDGQVFELAVPPFSKDNRTMVPLRFLVQNLDMNIDYNSTDKTITITQKVSEPVPQEPVPVNQPPVITTLGPQKDTLKIGEAVVFNYSYDNEEGESIAAEEWNIQKLENGETVKILGKPRAFFYPGDYQVSLRIRDDKGNWSETASAGFVVAEEKAMSEMSFKFSQPMPGEVFENAENVNFNFLETNNNTTFIQSGPTLLLSNSPEVVAQPGILFRDEIKDNFRLMYHHVNGAQDKQRLYIIAENTDTAPVTLKTLKAGVGGPVDDYLHLGQTAATRYLAAQPAASITIQPGQRIILNPNVRPLNPKEAVTGMHDFQADGKLLLSVAMGPSEQAIKETILKAAQEARNTSNNGSPSESSNGFSNGSSINTVDDDTKATTVNSSNQTPAETSDTSGNNNSGQTKGNPAEEAIVALPEENPGVPDAQTPEQTPEITPEEILEQTLDYLTSLPVLPRSSQQVRGTFPNGDRLVKVEVNDRRREKVILGKEVEGFEAWAEGVDPLTGESVKNIGNYGIVYRVDLISPSRIGVLFNPRGSMFKGAFQGFNGTVYKAPDIGAFRGLQKAAVLGVLEANKTSQFIYTPPSGSDTPVVIALIPKEFWD